MAHADGADELLLPGTSSSVNSLEEHRVSGVHETASRHFAVFTATCRKNGRVGGTGGEGVFIGDAQTPTADAPSSVCVFVSLGNHN